MIKFFYFKSGEGFCQGVAVDDKHYDLEQLWENGLFSGEFPEDIVDMVNLYNNSADDFKSAIAKMSAADLNAALIKNLEFDIPVVPSKIIAIGRNYAAHAKESGREAPEEPMLFAKLTSSMIADKEVIELPDGVGRVDHEIELCVIIGTAGKEIEQADAMSFVAGYTIFNDVTARDLQRKEAAVGHPWMSAKGFDTFGPCGPYLVPAVEVADPHNLTLTLKVNGEIRQQSTTANMVHSVPKLIEAVTKVCTLLPGDMIITGTPEGVSPLNAGDVITAEIDSLGCLESSVI